MNRLSTFFLLIGLSFSAAIGQPCLEDWDYFRPVRLAYSTNPDTLRDVQVALTIPTGTLVSSGTLRPDGADLRIVDDQCQPIHFYLDSAASSSSNTLWVKIPLILPQDTIALRIYYGNSDMATSAANGDSTFLFFEDGQGDSIESHKWETIGEYATWAEGGGEMTYSSTGITASSSRFKFVRSSMAFNEPVYADFSIRQSNSAHFGFSSDLDTIQRYVLRYSSGNSDTAAIVAIMGDTISNGYAIITDYPFLVIPRAEYNHLSVKVSVSDSGKFRYEEIHNLSNGESNTDPLEMQPFDFEGIHFILTSFSTTQVVGLKYLKVRKAVDAEAQIGFLPEQFQGQANGLDRSQLVQLRAYPNPVEGLLHLPESSAFSVSEYRLLNVQGQFIRRTDARATSWDLADLAPGLYLLQALDQEQVVGVQKIWIR